MIISLSEESTAEAAMKAEHSNPYNFNMPAESEAGMFFGRRQDMSAILGYLAANPGDSVALIGGRRIGKTSLLEALTSEVEANSNSKAKTLHLYPVFLDLSGEGVDSTWAFFRIIIERIQARYGDTVQQFGTAASVIVDGKPPAPAFGRMLESWSKSTARSQGRPLRLILLLDECEQITDQAWAPQLYSALRYLLVGQTTRSFLKVVLAGSHRLLTQVREHGSPLRNILKYHLLSVLDRNAARDLIIRPVDSIIPEELVGLILHDSGCHPFLIQYIMHHLCKQGIAAATRHLIEKIVDSFIRERNDFCDWANTLGPFGMRVYGALVTCGGYGTEQTIQAELKVNMLDLMHTLDALYYHGLISRDEASRSCRITADMFHHWFKLNVTTGSNADGRGTQRRLKVFFSYAHEDEKLRDMIDMQLGPLKHEEIIEVWWDRKLVAGDNWDDEIARQLNAADLILLLLSAPFLSSTYCYNKEMRRAVERHNTGTARIIPILLSPCTWDLTPISSIQGLPRGMKPLTGLSKQKREVMLADIAKGVYQAAQKIHLHRTATEQQDAPGAGT